MFFFSQDYDYISITLLLLSNVLNINTYEFLCIIIIIIGKICIHWTYDPMAQSEDGQIKDIIGKGIRGRDKDYI